MEYSLESETESSIRLASEECALEEELRLKRYLGNCSLTGSLPSVVLTTCPQEQV